MTDAIIRWEDPPTHANATGARTKYTPIADELKARPGHWAVIAEGIKQGSVGSLCNYIRRGKGPFAPTGSFEARSVAPAGGIGSVYARYIGEAAS